MSNLFSQIPAQVLNKVYKSSNKEDTSVAPKKKVKFFDQASALPEVIHEDSSSTEAESVIDIVDDDDKNDNNDKDDNEPTTNFKEESPRKRKVPKECRDAIIQTETKTIEHKSIGTQTDESLRNRPLETTEDDMHRMNMQSFAPIRPMPRRRAGQEPPLRIGLTLRGKKRNVFYPGEEDEDRKADGA